ncbi:von Willebrand factor D and EGF domain-containing protein [Ceratitis capitata]|uniref:von Willebrand factor D and EGF domain-containing protein n=1 Tax=Ceratitis capitata TaxID=7213 RepID=UPI00032A3DB7|nr:von Willebrand factor D and EGF domain-containing protein [Ceratitis capitata]
MHIAYFLSVLLPLTVGAHAQIKTSGIKTHYPAAPSSGNLVYNAHNEHNYTAQYNRTFIPADTYQGGNAGVVSVNVVDGEGKAYLASGNHLAAGEEYHYYGAGGVYSSGGIARQRAPQVLDPAAEFVNKTRSQMASGICYTEVATSTLVRDKTVIPAGNGTSSDKSKIQICCEGYVRNPHVYSRCDPVCLDDCPNGICTAPNTCVCIPGNVRNHEDKCISTCPIGCGNGVCDDQNQCVCKSGYTLDPATRQFCVPHCDKPCEYGKCVAPNKCDCFDGYRLTAGGVCEPKCDNCENGRCTAPGLCTCDKGYAKVDGLCEPVCTLGCERGRCVGPDVCACSQGFELDRTGTRCVPHCDQPCLNGVCDGANSCACNPGYVLDPVQKNICQPHCAQGCPNGYCTSPNFCVCKPGYRKSGIKGRQTCIAV